MAIGHDAGTAATDELERLRARVRELEAECVRLRRAQWSGVEEALSESEARFRAAAEGSMDAFFILHSLRDREGVIRDFIFSELNGRAEQMLGRPRDEFIGRGLCEMLPMYVGEGFFPRYVAVVESGTPVEEEFTVTREDGVHWLRHQVVPLGDGIAITSRDITVRRQAEEALRQSEERFRALVEHAPIGIAIVRGEVVLQVNRAFLELFGYADAAEAVGYSVLNHVAPVSRQFVHDRLYRRLQGEVLPSTYEAVGCRPDGSEFPYAVAVARFTLSDGPATVAFYSNLTERARAEGARLDLERRLLESQRIESLSVMAGGIAHDFNNLLAVILGNTELLALDLPATSSSMDAVYAIEAAAQQAARLTQQMLAYSGHGHFVVQQIDLSRLVDDMGLLLQASIATHAPIVYDLDPALPPINADEGQIQQIVLNLVINAAEASGHSPTPISIATRLVVADQEYLATTYPAAGLPEGSYVALEVADAGSGMDTATLTRIFEPFFTTKFTGRGLGLAAVLGIVRGHSGALRVESSPGRGTTMTALFPPAPAPEPPMPMLPAELGAQRCCTVLVIDDEASVCAMVRRALERSGYHVLTAYDGTSAVALLERDPQAIDCVLLDLTMPRLSGEQTLALLRAVRPDLAVVVMSGYSEEEMASRLSATPVAGFLHKPFSIDDLRSLVGRATSMAAAGEP